MSYAVLAELPEEHALRNTELAHLRAEYRNLQAGQGAPWKQITVAYGIGRMTYNQLRGTWIENNEWRVVG